MGNESPTSISTSGRVVRAALIIFPLGTVIFGVASFGVWWNKRLAKEEREARYARALRRDMSAEEVGRFVTVLKDVLVQEETQRLPAVASYLDSSMGPENMGYDVRRDRFYSGAIEMANVEVEVTGKQRPRQIILVLAPYGDLAHLDAECHALAMLMSLAHTMTGENKNITLRFAGVPVGIKDLDGQAPLERIAAASRARDERLMQVYVLGGRSDQELDDIRKVLRAERNGTTVQSVPATGDVATTLRDASALKLVLQAAIERE